MNDKIVWEGDEAAASHTDGSPFVISIDQENLFGGCDENGGFIGEMHVYFGGANQVGDPWMKSQMSAESVQPDLRGYTPAYRPYISVVIPTAYVGKQATIPVMWFEIQIVPDTLGLGSIDNDVNPAEILYEVVTNKNWGLSEAGDTNDVESLKSIGAVLQKEKLGLTVQLTNKQQARKLIDDICTHVNAVRFADPATGQMTYKLIRNDYDQNQLLEINASNCSKIEFVRQDWSNTVSEISVCYTEREDTYETGTVSDNDTANIEMQHGIKTTKSYDFPYFTTASNALWAAKREGHTQGYPLATLSMECNRKFAGVRIGDVLRVNFEPYGITNMTVRVTNVNLGTFEDGIIKIDAMEDVFSLAKTVFSFSRSTEWERNPLYPSGVQNFGFFELPFEILRSKHTYVYGFACQPTLDTAVWTIWRKKEGGTFQTTNTISKWTAAGRLIYDYSAFSDMEDLKGFQITNLFGIEDMKFELEAGSTADIKSARQGGKILIVGDEIMAYSGLSQLPNGNWLVSGVLRGIFDTVPKNHAAQETVFFLQQDHFANVTTGGPVCKEGFTALESYNITTASIDKKEDFDATKTVNLQTVRRAERPCVQGRIRMFAHNIVDKLYAAKIAGDLKITWIARNKDIALGCVSQDDINDYWTQLEYTVPDTLEYVTEVYVNDILLRKFCAKDTFINYTWAQRCLDSKILSAETRLKMYCQIGDFKSYQAQERSFLWQIPTLTGIFSTENAAAAAAGKMNDSNQIVVPAGKFNPVMYIDYETAPIILLGNQGMPGASGALYDVDGNAWIPDGTALLFHNDVLYDKITLEKGFVILTQFRDVTKEAQKGYMQWDGIKFNEISIV